MSIQMNQVPKRFGFWTATAMVVGIVIGSGVFFKADDVLRAAGGRLPIALIAWLLGGAIMVISAYVFSKVAGRIEKVNGMVDYFEAAYGETAGYHTAWFLSTIYYPALTAVLAWVSANYTMALLGTESGLWSMAWGYMTFFFILNVITPRWAGRWQVSATVLKLIPLVMVALFGTIAGLLTGQSLRSFQVAAEVVSQTGGGLAMATLSTAFAYEGWIVATSINAEIRDARKNLPRALVVGTVTVMIIYIVYYLGISGVLTNDQVLSAGDKAPVQVLSRVFGNIGGTLLSVFVIISCLGTLNGLVMGTSRGFFSIAQRGQGPAQSRMSKVNARYAFPLNSAFVGYGFSLFWLIIWYGNFARWWGAFMDISELPIVILYGMYFFLYLWVIRTFTDLGVFSRIVLPLLAGAGSVYIMVGGLGKAMLIPFLVLVGVIHLAGLGLKGDPKKHQDH